MQGYARFERGGFTEPWWSELVGGKLPEAQCAFHTRSFDTYSEVKSQSRDALDQRKGGMHFSHKKFLISENGYTVAESTNEKAFT